MDDRALARWVERLAADPADAAGWIELAEASGRTGRAPEVPDPGRWLPHALAAWAQAPARRGFSRIVLAGLGLASRPSPEAPGSWWRANGRLAVAEGDAYDRLTGLPLQVRRRADGVEMALVPAGEYTRGTTRDDWQAFPVGALDVGAFYLDVLTLGRREYDAVEPGHAPDRRGRDDLLELGFEDAMAYAEAVGAALPTEAQWEKAARGTDQRRFPWGDEAPTPARCAWWDQECNGPADLNYMWGAGAADEAVAQLWSTRPARRTEGRGPFGHEDLAGYLTEWCADAWSVEYAQPWVSARDTVGPEAGVAGLRPIRGGDWRTADVTHLEAAHRTWAKTSIGARAGVRLAVPVPRPAAST